jgi:nitrogen fixation protein NifB
MRAAVARHPRTPVNAHLGHAAYFSIHDISSEPAPLLETRVNVPHCGDDGGDHLLLDEVVNALSDCVAVVAAKIGPCARDALLARGIIAIEHDGPGLVGADRELAVVREYVTSVQMTVPVEVSA